MYWSLAEQAAVFIAKQKSFLLNGGYSVSSHLAEIGNSVEVYSVVIFLTVL